MAAYVEHRFKQGFLLDEERLRKLVNLIDQRLSKAEPPIKQNFRVFRADSYSYETTNVDDIVNEDHADWRRITRLQLEANREKEFEFELTFSEDGTSLKLNGDDRDQVYLLLSDLREYLKNEVNTCVHISRDTRRILSLVLPILLISVFVALAFWKIPDTPSSEDIQRILNSNDLEEKVNFLISNKKETNRGLRYTIPLLILMPLVMVLGITDIAEKVIIFLCPSNLFLFGPQKQKYDRRRRILGNLLWGVLIAFVISLLAGLAVWKLTG
ncbi:MAG: hypothetical protein WA081_06140 [Desulfosalsimonadaceae bacterium]